MKKLIALIVTLSMMLCMCTTAFAATTPEVAENSAITINPDGSFTVAGEDVDLTIEGEDIADNNQTTIVVVAGKDAGITTSSIQYINQQSKEEGTSFTFVPKDDTVYKASEKDVVLTAYIGGDAITRTTAGHITYKAEAVAPTMYTVTFDDGSNKTSTEYEAGKPVVAPTAPTKDGYTFKGWKLVDTDDSTAITDFTDVVANSNLDYVAVWEVIPVTPPQPTTYTVTFMNGAETVATQTYTEGATITAPAEPTAPEGQEFKGWKDANDAESTPTKDLSDVVVNGDMTFVAVFEAEQSGGEDTEEYTVTYMANGVVHAEVDTVNGIPVLPAEPTKANSGAKKYAFIGWYTDESFTTKLDKTATIATDTTLYAKFSQVGIYGDANADGAVKANDIAQIKKYLKDTAAYTGKANSVIDDCQTARGKPGLYGDANADGSVKANDIAQIKKYLKDTAAYTGTAATEMVMIKD